MTDRTPSTGQEPPAVEASDWATVLEREEFTSPTQVEQPDPIDEAARSPLSDQWNSRFPGSGRGPDREANWELARQAFADDETLELIVVGYNKGGLLATWRDLPGFVPASQLTDFPHFHLKEARNRELERRQNQLIKVKIIELEPEVNRLILSERAAQAAPGQRQELLHQVQVGDILHGCVTNLTDFGAFVDLGGAEGLIHLSELSWSRISHPGDVVRPRQEVDVLVINVDRDAERIGLSLKQLKPNPWQTVEERYQPGQLVEGVVSNVVAFGAFVLLEDELEGLIHVSKLAEETIPHPAHVLQTGDRVLAQVLTVDGRNHRLALSLSALNRVGNGR